MNQALTSLPMRDDDQEELERFVVENNELEELESRLAQFNIFEAIGQVRQELRHSDFLAFLLNPQEAHGLGDEVLKKLLQRVLFSRRRRSLPVNPIDFDVWSLDQLSVLREWRNIDLLLLDPTHELAIIIENKIDSGEHSGQLERYWNTVTAHYPGWKVVGLFLTPDGEEPSCEEYVPVSYEIIAALTDELARSRASTLGVDVRTLIAHYSQMLRRHIVSDSEIAELCRRIYKKHQKALDLIYEHRPDQQATVREILEHLVRGTPDVIFDSGTKGRVYFIVTEWDQPVLKAENGWPILLFRFDNQLDALNLRLVIEPGPQQKRQSLLNMALAHQPPFKAEKILYSKYNRIYSRSFLDARDYEDASADELEKKIRDKWEQFRQHDLPAIQAAIDLSGVPH
jgi:hypothetical protein